MQARLPKVLHAEARKRLREMSVAPTRSECERLRDEYVVDLSAEGRIDSAETVVRDWESFVSFLRLRNRALGASAEYVPVGVGVQRSKVEDECNSPQEATEQRVVPGVQGGVVTE